MKTARRAVPAIAVALLLLTACGGSGTGTGGGQQETSAKTVADNSGDFAGMQKCPESGTWDQYLEAQKQSDPSSYDTSKKQWDDLKKAGAVEGYVVSYAEKPSDCGSLAGSTPTTGKAVYVFAVRFKDEASAAASFKDSASTFHLSDAEVANIKSVGGTVAQGSSTGLGDNSTVVSASVTGFSVYVALWQKKKFLAAVIGLNLPAADGKAAAQRVDGRIK
jgi:hypothetical protein